MIPNVYLLVLPYLYGHYMQIKLKVNFSTGAIKTQKATMDMVKSIFQFLASGLKCNGKEYRGAEREETC